MHWQPTASNSMLAARAALNAQIRSFFAARDVLEVETPLMCHASGTDPNLHPVTAAYQPYPHAHPQTLYLQTSPEFAMKRLLCRQWRHLSVVQGVPQWRKRRPS